MSLDERACERVLWVIFGCRGIAATRERASWSRVVQRARTQPSQAIGVTATLVLRGISVARWIDDVDGTLVLSGGLRVASTWDHCSFASSRLSRGAARQADWFRPPPEFVGGRKTELWLCFRGRLQEIRLRLHVGEGRGPDCVSSRSRDFRHWTWLIESLGPPTFSNRGGVLYAFSWGWVHAGRGAIHISYPHKLPAVVLPGDSQENQEHEHCEEYGDYRCMRCAGVERLPYGRVIEVPRTRGGVPCASCGEVAWVRVGSEAERQRISARPDYCEVGRHMAKGVRSHRLVAKVDRQGGRSSKILRVRACAEHRAVLLSGFYGFVLEATGCQEPAKEGLSAALPAGRREPDGTRDS